MRCKKLQLNVVLIYAVNILLLETVKIQTTETANNCLGYV